MDIVNVTGTKPKPYCFVLMPFSEEFDDVYNLGIREACARAGAYCERVDEQIFEGTILQRIYNQISKADFIVADMSRRNPNVFYEVGYAHALDKPTILLTQDADDIPFDLKHFPHIVYERTKISPLIEGLTRRVRWFVQNPILEAHDERTDINLYLGQENLSKGKAILTVDTREDTFLCIRVENGSGKTLKPDDYGIGLIVSESYKLVNENKRRTDLGDGKVIYMLARLPVLFPGSSAALRVDFDYLPPVGDRDQLVFRVYTAAGSRDYPLEVQRPSDTSARERLLARAQGDSEKDSIAAFEALAQGWPDADTYQFFQGHAKDSPRSSHRSEAIRILAENWVGEDLRKLLTELYQDDPDEKCRGIALEQLATRFPGHQTNDLLRRVAAEDPVRHLRGLAFALIGGAHSEFGRLLAQDTILEYSDPLYPIDEWRIRWAAEKANIRPSEIDTALKELKTYLQWDPQKGIQKETEKP